MTRVCSSCGHVYGLIRGKAGLSHGICPACYPSERRAFGMGPAPYPYLQAAGYVQAPGRVGAAGCALGMIPASPTDDMPGLLRVR